MTITSEVRTEVIVLFRFFKPFFFFVRLEEGWFIPECLADALDKVALEKLWNCTIKNCIMRNKSAIPSTYHNTSTSLFC